MISFSMNPIRESITVVKEDKVCPWSLIPSIDRRDLGAVTPPRKYYTSNHTIAPAYNKGAYQVITQSNIKDIGK